MSAISPEWVNLMLDAADPRKLTIPAALEEMTKRARAIAIRRTQQLGLPDAHALRVAVLASEVARRLGLGKRRDRRRRRRRVAARRREDADAARDPRAMPAAHPGGVRES